MTSPSREERPGEERDAVEGRRGLGGLRRGPANRGSTPEERLELLLAERRRELEEHASRFEEAVSDVQRREELVRDARTSVERVLRVGAADIEARETDQVELAHELAAREERLRDDEARLARRRSELGAVELKRAAVEQREQALAVREADAAAREAELEARAGADAGVVPGDTSPSPLLLFVPGAEYRLLEIEHAPVARGDALELEGTEYLVGRVGASPLPGDRRRCAYLVLGARGTRASDGSS